MLAATPFAVVNLVAGASGVHFPGFLVRTIVSVTAGTALVVVVTTAIAAAVRHPAPGTIAGLLVATVLLVVFGPLGRRAHWDPGEWAAGRTDDG
jgi:uncharacterized membrane protein YdjX (TVP38/TMEM64 family)